MIRVQFVSVHYVLKNELQMIDQWPTNVLDQLENDGLIPQIQELEPHSREIGLFKLFNEGAIQERLLRSFLLSEVRFK